jgi:pimeloyl-ACP methyl ester carboxylesterase
MKLRMLVVIFPLILTLLVPSSAGQLARHVPLPADLQGELNGVPYRIRVPENWNGTLLVYAYGYAEAFMPPPLAPPSVNVETLLAKGLALAGIHAAGAVPIPGAATDAGWNFKERMQNTVALTAAFHGLVGRPRRTIMWGQSMGGLVTLALIEKFPGLYDGAVPLCAPGAGTPRMFDQKLDITLAYAVAFGWNDAWGTPGNLRDDLNFMTEVYPHVLQQLIPEKKGLWEFLRLVNRIPADSSFYGPVNYRAITLWLSIAIRPDMEQRAGGPVAQNIGRVYTLSDADKSYLLNQFGLDAEPQLAAMNAQTIYASDRNARRYAEHYYNPSGRIKRPVLTLHTTGDAAVIPNNESAYRTTVKQHGNRKLLMQQFSTGNGVVNTHCTFTPAQILAGIDGMMYWLDTGKRPDPAVFFPPALGFDPNFVPPPWPWHDWDRDRDRDRGWDADRHEDRHENHDHR